MARRPKKFEINDAVLPEDLAGGSSVIEYAAPAAAEDFSPDNPEGLTLPTRAEHLASSELDQWEGARGAAGDERMRARAMELQRHLDIIETALNESQGGAPSARDVVKQILVRLAGMQTAASAIARFVGLRGDTRLSVLMTDPELRALIDG